MTQISIRDQIVLKTARQRWCTRNKRKRQFVVVKILRWLYCGHFSPHRSNFLVFDKNPTSPYFTARTYHHHHPILLERDEYIHSNWELELNRIIMIQQTCRPFTENTESLLPSPVIMRLRKKIRDWHPWRGWWDNMMHALPPFLFLQLV